MFNFAKGTLVGAPLPFHVGQSINSLFRGQIVLSDGSTKSCILKNVPRVEILNEIISAALASAMNLPVPDVVLAFVPDTLNLQQEFSKCLPVLGGRIAFATVDVQVPNLAQRFHSTSLSQQPAIINHLVNWQLKSDLYCFDTWLANTDRHCGNVLLSSNGDLWLIDHGRCFIKENWVPAELIPNQQYQNRLVQWYTILLSTLVRTQTKMRLSSLEKKIKSLDTKAILGSVFALGIAQTDEERAILEFLDQRVSRVAADAALAL